MVGKCPMSDCNFRLCTSNKYFILDVGMEKEQKQELGWRVSVLPIPAFHHCEILYLCGASTQYTVECRNG